MVDILFSHINNLTKDLYEVSHYDQSQIAANTAKTIERLEKEVKVQAKVNKEQVKEIMNLDKQREKLSDELKISQDRVKKLEMELELALIRPKRGSRKRTVSGSSKSPIIKSGKDRLPSPYLSALSPQPLLFKERCTSAKIRKHKRSDTDKDNSNEKNLSKSKVRRNKSILNKLDKDRVNTELQHAAKDGTKYLDSPNFHGRKLLMFSYLTKNKSPVPLSKSSALLRSQQKALSFTTINNISMQNMLNRNISNYNLANHRSLLPSRDLNAMLAPPMSPKNPPSQSSPSKNIPNPPTRQDSVPNFQKKLKKYISKREHVLKKNCQNG